MNAVIPTKVSTSPTLMRDFRLSLTAMRYKRRFRSLSKTDTFSGIKTNQKWEINRTQPVEEDSTFGEAGESGKFEASNNFWNIPPL